MNNYFYSNEEFLSLIKRINKEMKRRATFKWWNPLAKPKIGEDRRSPVSLHNEGKQIPVTDNTYTINTPSTGAMFETKNVKYPYHGINPGNCEAGYISTGPNTSAAKFTVDEVKNLISGLVKINDIDLFYGSDEEAGTAFRDPNGIEDLLSRAESDKLHELGKFLYMFTIEDDTLVVSTTDDNVTPVSIDGDIIRFGNTAVMKFTIENGVIHLRNINTDILINSNLRNDPNGGIVDKKNENFPVDNHYIAFPIEDGVAVMLSGETDGEELDTYEGLGVNNFFDDYGAKPGDGNYHPFNRAKTPQVRRDIITQDDNRKEVKIIRVEGGIDTSEYGMNPRNPNAGKPYKSRPVFKGTPSTCNIACTGLCSISCDDQCSESCTSTCFNRCGNACTSTCGNSCTGCSSLCYTSCKSKCENVNGFACVNAGAKAVKITTSGGKNGEPGKNTISAETYSCTGCSYSCQFYPNKKTTCWDAGCMSNCFIECTTSCSSSCMGGCIDNNKQKGDSYKTGKGRGCSAGCTLNCIGTCATTCEGDCVKTCFHSCQDTCKDNCAWKCTTSCGTGCASACKNGCTGCMDTCESGCKGNSTSTTCVGCSARGGCTSLCQNDCNSNCVSEGCRSLCGIEGAGACESNCRINCMGASCTSMCSDQCSSECTSCVNTCGFKCGACTTQCSIGCSSNCEINCTEKCAHSCDTNCVKSCTEACGGCSDLCYSCVGMCIGVCSNHCEAGCSGCDKMCSQWCDSHCNQLCQNNCNGLCITTCTGSCATKLNSDTNSRQEELNSFKLIKEE